MSKPGPPQIRFSTWPLLVVVLTSTVLSFKLGVQYRALLNDTRDVATTMTRNEKTLMDVKQDTLKEGWITTATDDDQTMKLTNDGENEDEESSDDDEGMLAEHLLIEAQDIHLSTETGSLFDILTSVASACKSTLRVYQCHTPTTCLGMFQDGHTSLHYFESTKELAVDIFQTTSAGSLQELVPSIRSALQKYQQSSSEKLSFLWTRKARGLPEPLTFRSDFVVWLELMHPYRNEVTSVESDFQEIDILDFTTSDKEYAKDMANKIVPGYVEKHPELFLPNRILFLDGVMQSSRDGNAAYHEALVHPAMFAHPHPKRVAIIGGGECATLREVLKHNTIEKVVMIDIDQLIMDVSKQHLPDWNDCSDLVGSSRYCVDDPRAEIYAEDAFKWFMDRYLDPDNSDEPKFDVIIMDALDPQNVVEFAGALYGDGNFLTSLYNALSGDGILISQVGISPFIDSPAEQASTSSNRASFTDSLVDLGFQNVIDYEEGHCGFADPWSFRVAFKDYKLKANWRANIAEKEHQMQKRSVRTHSGKSPFLHFDGATMQTYHYPTKASEAVYCRKDPMPEECEDGRQPYDDVDNVPVDSFEVRSSLVGEYAGRGIFSKVGILEWSYIALESSVHQVRFGPGAYAIVLAFLTHKNSIGHKYRGDWREVYTHGYGCVYDTRVGEPEVRVDSGIMTFINHGCNGTSNIGSETELTEFTVDLENTIPDDFKGPDVHKEYVHSPFHERDTLDYLFISNHKPIRRGEELLDNYLPYIRKDEGWKGDVLHLRSQCKGIPGKIEQYQLDARDEL